MSIQLLQKDFKIERDFPMGLQTISGIQASKPETNMFHPIPYDDFVHEII